MYVYVSFVEKKKEDMCMYIGRKRGRFILKGGG